MNVLDTIHVNPRLETPIVLQLKEQLAWLIVSRQLQPGERLPPVRQLAKRLSINLHTVRSAYQRLETLGLVETRQGSGTTVLPYDPLNFFRAAASRRSHTIGVIVPSLSNPLYAEYLRGVEDLRRQAHKLLFVCDAHDDPEEALDYFLQLCQKGVDGILVFSFGIAEELKPGYDRYAEGITRTPFITIDWPDETGYDVLCDLEGGAYQSTRHLVEHGHRRIGMIRFALEIPSTKQMDAGYTRALREAEIEVESKLIASVYGFDMAAGEEGAQALLALPTPPTALFTASDLLAMGALRFIRSKGLRVPDDIALASINNIPQADLVDPPLTTAALPVREMGRKAMEMLQGLIDGEQSVERQIIFPIGLVVRKSCGCHAA